MSDKNLDKEVTVAEEVAEDTKKASKKKEAIVEPVAQEEAPIVEEAPVEVADEEVVGFVAPTASSGTTYNIYGPWDTAQNGDYLSYNTTVNTKDWAGAVVYQLGQYNTAQRGF